MRWLIATLVGLAVLVGAFIMVPTTPHSTYASAGGSGFGRDFDEWDGPRKSELRLAVEGRLRWLGVI